MPLPRAIPKAEAFPNKGLEVGKAVCASIYSGGSGRCGMVYPTTIAFAELSTNPQAPSGWDFSALGNLPCGTEMYVQYRGKTVKAKKLDVGRGGPGCHGAPRAIDLSPGLAAALGFTSGLDIVHVAPATTSQETTQKLKEEGRLNTPVPGRCSGSIEFPEALGVGGGAVPGVDQLAKSLCELGYFFKDIASVIEFLTSPSGWVRIGKVVFGGVIVILALNQLSKISGGPDAVGGAKKVAEVGAAAAV